MTDKKELNVAVIGAGLVGSLAACFFAKYGHEVHLYESRDDIRNMKHVPGRSINMSLSHRGLKALESVGLDHVIKQHTTAMHGRLIHKKDGSKKIIPYGKEGQYIFSISRRCLNELLISGAERNENIHCHFKHKLVEANLENGSMIFKKTDTLFNCNSEKVSRSADLIVGCDGAHSIVREHMMKRPWFNYSQFYIPHGYIELRMPSTSSGQFAMEEHYLHIWPRSQFMMIALPNKDGSYTCTLFMPYEIFDTLKNKEAILTFFKQQFPDSLPLLGEEYLVEAILNTKTSPLFALKCKPYHVGGKSILLGDAAHAMVPFYGQGMNCGFEDCLLLEELLEKHDWELETVLNKFTELRNPDAEAIVDLTFFNYIEIRDLVNSRSFLLRKQLDNFLNSLMPSVWSPLYSMVTFTRTRYHVALANRQWQNKVLLRLGWLLGLTVTGGAIYGIGSTSLLSLGFNF